MINAKMAKQSENFLKIWIQILVFKTKNISDVRIQRSFQYLCKLLTYPQIYSQNSNLNFCQLSEIKAKPTVFSS